MEKPTTLIMFSGGLDSTGVFWKLINESETIHVHHMYLVNKEGRAKAENKAVKDIVEYMNKIRRFGFSESYHEYPCYNNNFIWDSDIFSFMAGSICLSFKTIKRVAIGTTASDLSPSLSKRIERANKIFDAFETSAEKVHPMIGMKKKQIYEMLPPNLRILTWSCRKPIYEGDDIKRCGNCKTCKQMSAIVPNDNRYVGLGDYDLA
jgi:7-cyano-7-deazaguanine synthase in queuosine biosynthesis